MAEVFEISALVLAKLDRLEQGMRRAEQIVSDSTKRLGSITDRFTPFARIARGLITLQAVNAALRGTTAIVSAIQGDTEAIERAVRRLPLGIGATAGAAIDLFRQLSGAAEKAEALRRSIEGTAKLRGAIRGLDEQLALQGLAGAERQRAVQRQRFERDVSALGAVTGGDPQVLRQALQRRRTLFESELQKINDAEARAAEESRLKRRETLISDLEATEQAAERKAQIQQNLNRRLLSLDSQIQVAQLQQQGRALDAQLAQITASFNARLASAESTAEKERIARLGILELEAAKRAARRAGTGEQAAREIVLSRSAIGGQQRGAALAFDRDREIKVEDQDDVIQQLKLIVENTRGGVGAAIAAIAG